MKRLYIFAAIFTLLPWLAAAQVEKQVEVTKAYVPSVERATKLSVVPDMVDTVKLRPEIDYSITPLSFASGLETRPIKPATVTYWQFNRPQTFYIKAGAGYPLNSVFDFYASSQNPGTGYVVGYVNHQGRYADIANELGAKNNSMRMNNRIGAAAGKYFGQRTLEGELSYENRLDHNYGAISTFEVIDYKFRAMSDYGDAALKIRFGDDFTDLSRVNFDLAVSGNLFWDHSDFKYYSDYDRARQTDLGASFRLARDFGRHLLRFEAGYNHISGSKGLDGSRQSQILAGLRYGYRGGVVAFEVGADYCRDKVDSLDVENYILPFAKVNLNLGTPAIGVFAEMDSRVRDNSYRTLTRLNPYVMKYVPMPSGAIMQSGTPVYHSLKSTVDYNVRFGIAGSIARERLNYRLYAGYTRTDNQLYWLNTRLIIEDKEQISGYFFPNQAQQDCFSIHVEGEWRPASTLRLSLGLHGYRYTDEFAMTIEDQRYRLDNGRPAFEVDLGVHYDLRKVSFGLSLRMQGKRSWSTYTIDTIDHTQTPSHADLYPAPFTAPFAADLGLTIDWRVSRSVTIFAEGRNLANQRLYEYAWYPEYGVNCTLGVKANF